MAIPPRLTQQQFKGGIEMTLGFYPAKELPNEKYHKEDGISSTQLRSYAKTTPAKYFAKAASKPSETPAMVFGSLFHRNCERPGSIRDENCIRPEGIKLTTRAGKEWKAAQNPHKRVVSNDDCLAIEGMTRSLLSHPEAKFIVKKSDQETSGFAVDVESGLLIKARADLDPPGEYLWDIKSSDSATPLDFGRKISDFRYHWQAAHYLHVWNLLGKDKSGFGFIVVEKQVPYEVAIYTLSGTDLHRATTLCRKYLNRLATSLNKNYWPTYPEQRQEIALPVWAIKQEEDLCNV